MDTRTLARQLWLGLAGPCSTALRRVGPSLLLAVVLFVGTCGPLARAGLGIYSATAHAAPSNGGKPTRFGPRRDSQSILHLPPAPRPPAAHAPITPVSLDRGTTTAPGSVALDPGRATRLVGGAGPLEVDVPAGAVTAADVAAAGGGLSLQVAEIAPAAGSSAGGSGLVSFGTYLLQVVDARGHLAAHGLRRPVTLGLRLPRHTNALDLSRAFVVFNGALPRGLTTRSAATPYSVLAPTAATAAPVSAGALALGRYGTQAATLGAGRLTVVAQVGTPSTSATWNTDAPVGVFDSPDPFNVTLNAGALTTSIPIDVPAGPGGLTPPVALSYNSATVSEQHNPQGATGWVSEGWGVAAGSITWAEHDVDGQCETQGTCGPLWEDSWQLSDPFGTAVELIPPTIATGTFYGDSGNAFCGGGLTCPVIWHTAPESYAKVVAYQGPVSLGSAEPHPPCFRVWLPNGLMEEYGCTSDASALVHYPAQDTQTGSVQDYVTSWLLDLITDPSGNQIHFTYQADTETHLTYHYPRDTVLKTIEWDSPACRNAQTACASTWHPQMRVSFTAGHTVSRLTNSPSGCDTSDAHIRCDDPLDLSPNGIAAPVIQSTFVLNALQVQVCSGTCSTTPAWQTLRTYDLSYEQGGPLTITDPATGKSESTAGYLDLTKVQELGDDGATALPTLTFGYTAVPEDYEDDAFTPNPSTNCGFSWNTSGSGCLLWSKAYAGSNRYLEISDNGLGMRETFIWSHARNNTHGVNGGGSNTANPLYCDTYQTGYPCDEADDQNWSREVLTESDSSVVRTAQAGQGGTQTSTTITSKTAYTYTLTYPLVAQMCSDCVAGMYWGNQTDEDYLDYYNGKFMGFAQARVAAPDGSVQVHKYDATEGYGVYDVSQACPSGWSCVKDPWWDLTNLAHGRQVEEDDYDTNGTTLLAKSLTYYQAVCPPSGVAGSPADGYGNWNGNLVSELDHDNPVGVCDVQTAKVYDYTYDGSASPTYASSAYTYDTSGRVTQTTDTDNGGSPWQIVHQTAYIWNNAINTNVTEPNPPTGTYILARVAYHAVKDINGTTRYACSEHAYDGHAYTTGQNAGLSQGDLTSHADFVAGCGNSGNGWAPSGPITSTYAYDGYGNAITADDADANAGDARHLGCTNGSTQTLYSACAGYDLNFGALPIWDKNAANQIGYVNYAATTDATGGYGMWPTSTRDPNGQTTTYAYDPLGRPTSLTLPGETAGDTTTSWTYTNWCAATGAQTPCVEVDQTQRVSGATGDTITARAFYDGDGRLVETRVPAPGGQDVVRYRYFEPSGHNVYASVAYFVTAYAGGPGSAAYSLPDSTQTGTIATYDGLGRTIETYDPLGDITTASFAVVYVAADTSYYEQVTLVDPLGRERASLTDAFGRDDYDESFTGTGTGGDPYSLSASTKYSYDYLGDVTQILHPDGVTKTTFAYDVAGRQTGLTDPDRGTESYTYDANGNPTKVVDARGSAGTVYADYDGLDRQLWRNTSNSPTGAYVTYSYDGGGGSPCTGTYLVGRLCKESFTGGPGNSLSGAYTYGYDARGALTSATETVGGAAYTVGQTYDDAGAPTTATYPDGEQVTTTYTQGWLGGLSTQQGSTTTTLLGAATYTGVVGAAGLVTQASLGNGTYTYQADYDLLLRPTTTLDTRTSDGLTEFSQTRNFNAAGQVTSLATTVPGQTDNQAFCYDDLGRLTWATSQTATGPCGAQNTAGTLTGAAYTQSFAYDTMDRLTSGPLGSYTYADGAHVHAATAIGPAGAPTWTASYDAAGNMTCRAATSASTCAGGSPTGAPLAYDAEGQLVAWQNAPSAPTTTAGYLYDGEGNRVEQQVTSGGTTTSTVYVGGVEEVSTTGSQTTTTTYYYAGGQRVALAVNGTFTYLASDGLGSANVALDANGTAQAVTLYAPYGTVRYASGAMPGSDGYTGHHADAATGLDYYGARYYDPAAGQFTSADTLLAGLNRYGYVGGDPENATDPSGHACDSLEFASCLAPVDEGTEAPSAFRSGMRGHTLDPDYQDPAPAGTTGPPPLPSVPDPYPGLGVGGGYGPRTQPPGDDLQPFNQRTWAAARAAVDESNPLGPTENQQNLPKPTPPPPGPTPPSPSPGPTSTLTGGGSGDAPPGAPPAPPGDGCDDGGANPNTVTVYRVQGGGPTGSKPRIKIRFGKVLISGRDMLFLNFGNTERAMELLARRSAGGPAQIVAFEVAAEFVQWLRDNAVPEAVSKQFPGSPIAVDLNDGDQFGLPSTLFRRLFENMVPGSGHVLPNEETC